MTKEVQPLKTLLPMMSKRKGNVISFKEVHSEKALVPIGFTLYASFTVVSLSFPEKTWPAKWALLPGFRESRGCLIKISDRTSFKNKLFF